jgi:GntR family transcriptional repressor for pyruvate dehydrogenase complex
MIDYRALNQEGLSKQIADAIRAAIVNGKLLVGERLPTENELAEKFGVSRPTVREALKRLAAQNLIHSKRGPSGGNFVTKLSQTQAREVLITTATLVVSMGAINLSEVVEARRVMESACLPFAVERRSEAHLERLRQELECQRRSDLSDEAFCESDVRFHRTVVDAADNAMLSFQMAGVIEAMQPILNKIINRVRDRVTMIEAHATLASALERRDLRSAEEALRSLTDYIRDQALRAQQERENARRRTS